MLFRPVFYLVKLFNQPHSSLLVNNRRGFRPTARGRKQDEAKGRNLYCMRNEPRSVRSQLETGGDGDGVGVVGLGDIIRASISRNKQVSAMFRAQLVRGGGDGVGTVGPGWCQPRGDIQAQAGISRHNWDKRRKLAQPDAANTPKSKP